MKCETLVRYLNNATGRVHIFTDHDLVLNLYFEDDEFNYIFREGYNGDSSILSIIELHKGKSRNKYLIDVEKVSYMVEEKK